MMEVFDHLSFTRLEPVNPRRTIRGWGGNPPEDPALHGRILQQELASVVKKATVSEPGFDPRLLVKLKATGLRIQDIEAIGGLSVVSQEDSKLTVLFATEDGRAEFARRLEELASGGVPTRKEVLWAIQGIDGWTAADRTGYALRSEGIPETPLFVVDVELWPLPLRHDRQAMRRHFEHWCDSQEIQRIDSVNQINVIMYRLRVSRDHLAQLLDSRDVRTVDLPPKYQLSITPIQSPIDKWPTVIPPPSDAPHIAVLDTGIVTNHALLAPGIADAQSFVQGHGAADEEGHGTMVAGHALFGDVADALQQEQIHLSVGLFSGRVIVKSESADDDTPFLENRLRDAVEYFAEHYGCRIYNVSIGDRRKPYTEGHVRGLAPILDELARNLRVLFVVSAGNFIGTEDVPTDWRTDYPDYLLDESARIIDPAPALNVLTVGSIARHDRPRLSQRFPNDPAYQPIAARNYPSPFSRSGPGPGGAIKPELVEYGGNQSVDLRTGNTLQTNDLLGELSTAHTAVDRPLSTAPGTSYAAPKVAHLAGRLLHRYPDASMERLRALIVAHAELPARNLFGEGNHASDRLLLGYGKPNSDRALSTSEDCVTLVTEDRIGENEHHFYEIPIPDDFLRAPAVRDRSITVALAYTPAVRRTRISYRNTRLSFRVVRDTSLENVLEVFRKTPLDEQKDIIPEYGDFRPGPQMRNRGTTQAATYLLKQVDKRWQANRLFVVVTHQPESWAENQVGAEFYALVVVVHERSGHVVRYYTQIREQLRVRDRVRIR